MQNNVFGTERISKLLLRLAPPIMFSQLIQAMYNIIDSYFVGQYSTEGLAALSVLFPIQLLISSLAVGTRVGVNTLMSRYYGEGREKKADTAAGVGFFLSLLSWVIFAAVFCGLMLPYSKMSLTSAVAQNYAFHYGMIVCGGSIGIFLESNWTKVLQARGYTKTPMIAQITGAVLNIILDYVFIFGVGFVPRMGVDGAAIATVIGQITAAVIVGTKAFGKIPKSEKKTYIKAIYKAGIPNILMNATCTIYIVALNLILKKFSDDAVTVLGLYYKLQMFYLIPVLGLETCIVPMLSYNYAAKKYERCKKILSESLLISAICMLLGTALFEAIPSQLIEIFAKNEPDIVTTGTYALRVIAISFVPIAPSLMMPTFFQAIGRGKESVFLSLLRQLFLLIPVSWGLSFLGLKAVWWAFPITEIITAAMGLILYFAERRKMNI